ncbi:MAG: thermonuclease family protein, partial [Defluviicoccus sp.]|nr:thermonuclease family protein [Defluviicoccus sp.]
MPALAALVLLSHAASAAETPRRAVVDAAIDGDTVALESGVEVRLVGIQAPRLALGRAGLRDWPLAAEARA